MTCNHAIGEHFPSQLLSQAHENLKHVVSFYVFLVDFTSLYQLIDDSSEFDVHFFWNQTAKLSIDLWWKLLSLISQPQWITHPTLKIFAMNGMNNAICCFNPLINVGKKMLSPIWRKSAFGFVNDCPSSPNATAATTSVVNFAAN